MDNRPPTLEELIQRELSKLPERPAPGTLVPRVLAEIQARQSRHWWQRPWSHWPMGLRIVSIPFMLASAGGTLMALSFVYKLLLSSLGVGQFSARLVSVSALWDVGSALGNAVLILGRGFGQQWWLLGLFVALAMYLTCVGLGTLCYRMAFHSRWTGHE